MIKKLKNYLLDKSVYFSFDSTGYKRHAQTFLPLNMSQSIGKTIITGGTSGIGLSLRNTLLNSNQETITIGRNQRGIEINEKNFFYELDMSDWKKVKEFAKEVDEVQCLVFNAGGMPENYTLNPQGYEFQFSSQLMGHLLLFFELERQKKLKEGAKVIIVSSGGMLLKRLDLRNLFTCNNYDKVQCYANVKRVQVILIEELAKLYPSYFFASMHPGWVDTEAVRVSLPKFYDITKNRLRVPKEGADTIAWLLFKKDLPSGKFWFDRKEAEQYPFKFTRETTKERKELVDKIFEIDRDFNLE